MFKIGLHIIEEMRKLGVTLEIVNLYEKNRLLELIYSKFVDEDKKITLWESFNDFDYYQSDIAWHLIKNFVGEKECIMFFNQNEETEMFVLKSGKDLDCLLSETYGFEFYITDAKANYVICLNHHNILYGCGTAKPWIGNLK